MEKRVKNKSIEIIKGVLKKYLKAKGLRNTPERYTILEEIYNQSKHFNVEELYLLMLERKYHISKATIYNSIDVFLDAGLIRKHQFGDGATYEKSYFDKQHDHLVIYKDKEEKEIAEIIEFCDPRIQAIKASIEEAFGVEIDSHTLYFYGRKKETENPA